MEIRSEFLNEHGFVTVHFEHTQAIADLQALYKKFFKNPTQWHLEKVSQDEHVMKVKELTDAIAESQLAQKLFLDNIQPFISLFGPDIDIQAAPHIRVSRPKVEEDLIGWHRDTFYGNSLGEINIWMPIFELQQGAGLQILDGSHKTASQNVRDKADANEFKKNVAKGSVASQAGYPYAPKTDDSIENMDPSKVKLLAPKVGEAILFFGYCVHKATNTSIETRASMDFRIKPTLLKTTTKPGYYVNLHRGPLTESLGQFLS